MLSFLTGRYRWVIVSLLCAAPVVPLKTISIARHSQVLAPTLRDLRCVSMATYSYVVTGFLVTYTIGFAVAGACWTASVFAAWLPSPSLSGALPPIAHGLVGGWLWSALSVACCLASVRALLLSAEARRFGEWIPQTERGLATCESSQPATS